TTIKCTTGIASFQGGTIKVFGIDVVTDYREARKKIGLAPQDFNVDIFATAYDILWYVGGYYGIPSASRKKSVNDVLERFELGEHSKKSFQALSGGLKRRVMLARAMVHDPDLLILDEPTAGVDVEMRHDLWRYLQDLNKAGKTILLTSHYLEEVEFLCNRIAIINGGKIAAIGDKSEFTSGGRKLEQTYLEITKEGKSL
ncbi:MAG: ABC transporter ATP-binding protein, partial [Candidatus Ryanbacteria bacterium]|nr:ABC transporter ATP-binding protein [Candidatus Ryanbacteria bacterium]